MINLFQVLLHCLEQKSILKLLESLSEPVRLIEMGLILATLISLIYNAEVILNKYLWFTDN